VTFLLGSPFDNQQVITAQTAIGAVTLTANAVIFLNSGGYFATPPTNNPLLNTWSLSVEEQFYLVFPVVIILLWFVTRKIRKGNHAKTIILIGLGAVTFLSFTLNVLMGFEILSLGLTDPDWFAFYSSPTRAWEFTIGGMAYLAFGTLSSKIISTIYYWIGFIGIVLSVIFINELMVFPGVVALLPVVATVLMLIGGSGGPVAENWVSSKGLVRIGDVSYSWYLWHWPLIAFSVMLFPDISYVALIAALLSLPVSLFTTKYVERPIRFSVSFSRVQTWSLFLISAGLIIIMGLLLMYGSQRAWGNSSIQSMEDQVAAEHLWITSGCNSSIPLPLRGPECEWNSEAGGRSIYLLGDSLAGSLSEGILGAGQALDRPVLVGTQGACPFVGNGLFIGSTDREECTAFVDETTEWLKSQSPGDVVMSSSLGYLGMRDVGLSFPSDSQPVFTSEAKTKTYIEGLSQTVEEFVNSGHRVQVVLPPPGFPDTLSGSNPWFPSQCNTLQALSDISKCGATRSESDAITETTSVFSELTSAVENAGGSVIDIRDQVCVAATCSTNIGNKWNYLDGTHISVGLSEQLAPVMTKELFE